MNDSIHIQSAITFFTGSIVVDFLLLLFSVIYLFIMSYTCGFVSLCIILFLVPLSIYFSRNIAKYQKELMRDHAKSESHFFEIIQNISVVKLFGKETFFSQISNFVYTNFQQSVFRLQQTTGKYSLLAGLSNSLVITGVVSVAAVQVLNKQLKIGELTAIIGLASSFIGAVSSLALTNIRLKEAQVAFERLYEFAGLKPEFEIEKQPEKLPNINSISLSKVAFRFPGKSKLLDNINIEIKKGKIICIFGEIGCGKSTILNILSRMYTDFEGQILTDSEDWNKYSTQNWRKIVSVVTQNTELFNSTVIENIDCNIGSQSEVIELEKFCTKYGFNKWFDKLPQGFATILGQSGAIISGGQRQMVAFARALYAKPQFLLLDEPTSGMDRNSEKFVMDLLSKIKQDVGIVFITHKIDLARQADQIYVIENGLIVDSGNHIEICNGNSIYSDTYSNFLS